MISIKLKETTKAKGFTLTDIANATHISMNTLSVLGRGGSKGIQFDTLEKICRFLDCTPNDILSIENESVTILWKTNPQTVGDKLLFTGEVVPTDLLPDSNDSFQGINWIGFPFYAELSATPEDGLVFIRVGLPTSAIPESMSRSTASTREHSMTDTIDYLKRFRKDEREALMLDSVKHVKDNLDPITFADVKQFYCVWVTTPAEFGEVSAIHVKA